jgi:hypothetical protein
MKVQEKNTEKVHRQLSLNSVLQGRNVEDKVYLIDVKDYFDIDDTSKAEELQELLTQWQK